MCLACSMRSQRTTSSRTWSTSTTSQHEWWPTSSASNQTKTSEYDCVCVLEKISKLTYNKMFDDIIFSSVDGVWLRPQWTHTTCQPRTGLCFPLESYRLHSMPKITPSEQSRVTTERTYNKSVCFVLFLKSVLKLIVHVSVCLTEL